METRRAKDRHTSFGRFGAYRLLSVFSFFSFSSLPTQSRTPEFRTRSDRLSFRHDRIGAQAYERGVVTGSESEKTDGLVKVGFQGSNKNKRRLWSDTRDSVFLRFISLSLTLHLGPSSFDSVFVGLIPAWGSQQCSPHQIWLSEGQKVMVFAE